MKIQRYIGKDMRSALAQVRDALGPDAVILSSGRVGEEVEVIAAVDFEAVQQAMTQPAPGQAAEAYVERAATPPRIHNPNNIEAVADARFAAPRVSPAAATPETAATAHRRHRRASSQISAELAPEMTSVDLNPQSTSAHEAQAALASEMKDLRRLLEAQLATLTWNDFQRRSPVQAALHKELAQLGVSTDLTHSLVRKIPTHLNFTAARRFALATLARTVQVTGDRWLEKGGIVAFAGPAGAGKTTLLAKLAARWVLRHGPRRVAMVSADSVRIGAHEQFHTLGRLLGVSTHNVFDVAELPELLFELRHCSFVMIDTAGTSPRDPELARQLRLLSDMQASIETSLVLPASSHSGALEEVVQRFAMARPASVCITRIDEAMNLGGILSTLVRHKLPAAYVSDGQRVPEDLTPARAHQLVSRAVEIASHHGNTADDELMQRRIVGGSRARQ